MAKLTDDVLYRGRSCVAKQDLPGFEDWAKAHAPAFDTARIRKTLEICFAAQDMGRAVSFFNTCFVDYDPTVEVWRRFVGCGVIALLGLGVIGALGGLVFLVWVALR